MQLSKHVGALLLTAAMITQLLPTAGAAVSSGNAKIYLQAVQSAPNADSYLIDFDRDGVDELLLLNRESQYGTNYFNYQVWSGSHLITKQSTYVGCDVLVMEKANREFLVERLYAGEQPARFVAYTLENDKWILEESLLSDYDPVDDQSTYRRNNETVSFEDFQAAYQAFHAVQQLPLYGDSHSIEPQLQNAIDPSVDGYEDVLHTLSSSEKEKLFTELLGSVCNTLGEYDYQTTSDEEIIHGMEWMQLTTQFPFEDYGGDGNGWGVHTVFKQANFTKLTNQLFNRTIDYSKFTRTTLPDLYDYQSFLYQGNFYLLQPQAGYVGYDRYDAQKLYSLGGNKYSAVFRHWYAEDETDHTYSQYYGPYTAVVRKNADGAWTLLRLYPENYVPTSAELAAFVAPSNWAKAEVEAADAAGLIPELTGAPAWQDNATRLQFAELAVRFAEKVTGKTLAAAPSSTFSDTKSEAVLKAYQAGIVNGTSDTVFSPNESLTREQLATMLWRAIQYVQKETGKTALSAGGSLTGYADSGKVSSWARDAVSSLAQNGIMKGTSSTQLSPADSCSVEQSVLLVYRTYLKLQ